MARLRESVLRTLPCVGALAIILPVSAVLLAQAAPPAGEERSAAFQEEASRTPAMEEPSFPEISLSREGHADVNAKRRSFTWRIQDPDGLSIVSVRVVMIDPSSMKPTELFRSDDAKGTVGLEQLGNGPGLYALLVVAKDKQLHESKAGLRLSYTETRPDCPEANAWWPSKD